MKLSDLEKRVLDMMLDHPGERAEALRAQATMVEVIDRKHTGLSLQADLEAHPAAPVAGNLDAVLGGIIGWHPSDPAPIGFNLFIRGGKLTLLEGVAFSDVWPDDESTIRLEQIPRNFSQDRERLSG